MKTSKKKTAETKPAERVNDLDWNLMPWSTLIPIVRALEFDGGGAGLIHEDLAEALRQVIAFASGDKLDPHSGESRIAHAIGRLLYVLTELRK